MLTVTKEERVSKTRAWLERGARDPLWWVRHFLGWHPWSIQAQILESLRDHRETAVRSCHSAGKSAVAAAAVLWFLATHRPSTVITTAPTDRQVRGILWKEIATLHASARIDLGGELLGQELRFSGNRFAIGFTSASYDPDRFQGWHSRNVLIVLDEASGITEQIYGAVDGIMASGFVRLLQIGNPTDPSGPFAKACKSAAASKFKVSAFDTPNFTTYGITDADIVSGEWSKKLKGDLPMPWLVGPEYAALMYAKHGHGSPWYASRVLAEFPESSKDTLIPLAWIEAAQQRDVAPGEPNELGVDVGRGGDQSVIAHRRGNHVRIIDRINSADTMETVGRVVLALRSTGATCAKVDVVGIGAGVVDRGKEQGLPFVAANAGGASSAPDKFLNARAEWFWGLRERFEDKAGVIDIDPEDGDLAEQLSELRWKPDSRGRVTIEPKDEMKKRLGRSPDDADAVALAFAQVGDAFLTTGYTPATKSASNSMARGQFKVRGGGIY